MRKIAIMIATVAMSAVSIAAQENYNAESAKIKSVEVNADRTVTLRLKAPQGHKATAFGTFVPNAWAEMTYNPTNGYYEYTTPEPVSPIMHTYKFYLDDVGFTDPENVHVLRDVTWQNNYLLPKGDGNDQASLMSVNDVPHGLITPVWYYSDSEKKQRRMNVYLPASYLSDTNKRYPVLYLLHGRGGDENAWVELGHVPQIMDNLIARGDAEEMIVVIPNGVIDIDAAAGCGTEGLIQPSADFPRLFTGEYDMAFPEIVGFVDKHFRTQADRDHRAIAGLSMGGYNSMNISREYPDLFSAVGLFSAATTESVKGGLHLIPDDAELTSPIFKDIDAKLQRQFARGPLLYWIAIGNQDFLYQSNMEYLKKLDDMKLPYIYHESNGGHEWRNWRDYIIKFAPMLFKQDARR